MKTLFTFFVFIFLLTTAKAQEIDVTLSATGGFSVIDFGGTPTLFRILGNGKVGIGTTSPSSLLDIRGTDAIMELSGSPTDKEGLAFQIDYSNFNTSSRIFFRENSTNLEGTSLIHAGLGSPVFDGTTFTQLSFNALYIVTHTNSAEGSVVMIIKKSGDVGIGTTDPKSKLHVTGLPEYANNAAAITGGLTAGAFYRTSDFLKVVH